MRTSGATLTVIGIILAYVTALAVQSSINTVSALAVQSSINAHFGGLVQRTAVLWWVGSKTLHFEQKP